MDIVEEYIEKIISLSKLSRDKVLDRLRQIKEESRDLSDIGALFKLRKELGLHFYVKPIQKYDDSDDKRGQKTSMDLKMEVEELKKFILSSPDRFKVISYLLSHGDNQRSSDILRSTNVDVLVLDEVLRESQIKGILDREFKKDSLIPETFFSFKKTEIINILKNDLSKITPDNYLGAYFTSQDKEYQKQMTLIQKELDNLFRKINNLDIIEKIGEITGYDKLTVIDEILAFISSSILFSALTELNGVIVPWIRTINKKTLECNLRLEEAIIPLHFYGKSINRLTKGKIKEFLLEEDLLQKEDIKKKITRSFTTVNIRGKIIGGIFFVFDFQEATFNAPWDDKKRFFRYNYSYPLQKALNDNAQKLGDQFWNVINTIEEEVLTKMKATSTIYTSISKNDYQVVEELQKLPEELFQRSQDIITWSSDIISPAYYVEDERIKGISIANCKLDRIPESLGNLDKLEVLVINNTTLTHFPDILPQLKQLKTLVLIRNDIDNIPDGIEVLPNLQLADFTSNRISAIPSSLFDSPSLIRLTLDFNQIDQFPEIDRKNTCLKELSLNYNNIKEVPEDISNLVSLEVLGLKANDIINISESIMELKKLKMFNLNGNLQMNIKTGDLYLFCKRYGNEID